MNLKPSNIPNLTPLRGIAALMVVVFHFDAFTNFVGQEHTLLIKKSYLMVDLFFIMSGFIMFHVYGSKFANAISQNDFIKFIGARFARIYPLHFFTLLFSVALFYGLQEAASPINNPMAIPTNILLLHSFGIHKVFTWNVPSWSISAEWWAYMIFPILIFVLAKFKKGGVILLSLASILMYFSILYFLPRVNPFVPTIPVPHDLDVTYDYGYIRGIAGFIAGMIIYLGFKQKEVVRYFNNDLTGVLIVLVTILLFHFGVNDLLIIVSLIFLVLAIASNEKIIHKLLKFKWLQYLGDISYSIYLTHMSIMFFVAIPLVIKLGYNFEGPGSLQLPFFTGLWICGVFLLSVIIISSASYYLLERPSRNWLNKKFGN